MKKILIIGSKEFFSLEKMYFRAFKNLGYKPQIYHVYDIRKNFLARFFWKYFRFFYFIKYRLNLINFFKNKNNKFDLIIVFKGIFLNKKTILKCKKYSTCDKWSNIYPDDPFNVNYFKDISNSNTLKSLNCYDFFFIWSHKLFFKLRKIISKNKIYYLPFGYDEFLHKGLKERKKKYDISFIGTADKERYDFLKKIKKHKVIIAGDGWKKKIFPDNFTIKPKLNAKNSSKIIQISKISLNLLRKQNRDSHNMKTFEIPAMNGLMLTPRSSEQNFFFPENVSSFMFSSLSEFNNKVNYILSNKIIAKKVQKESKIKVKNNTYTNRVKKIIEITGI